MGVPQVLAGGPSSSGMVSKLRRKWLLPRRQLEILKDAEPGKKAEEVEIELIARLRRHAADPKFTAWEHLERIPERHEQGFLTRLEFLKEILELAREVVEAEKIVDPVEDQDRAKAALTELFSETKSRGTYIIAERIVNDIETSSERFASRTGSTPRRVSDWCKRSCEEPF